MTSLITPLAAEGESHGPLAFVWIESLLLLVFFGIVFFLLWKYVVPNFEKTYAARTSAIEGGLAEAEQKQAEADKRLAELEKQLGDARHEAARGVIKLVMRSPQSRVERVRARTRGRYR